MAVVRATRRPKALSPCSRSSFGFGSSTSATGARASPVLGAGALANLLAHRVPPRLEGRAQPLGLLLEQVAALVEPLAGQALGLAGEVLGAPCPLAAALGEDLARFPPGAGRGEDRRHRAHGGAEEEPAEVSRRVAPVASHRSLLPVCGIAARTRPRLSGALPPAPGADRCA